jgi:acetyltransferase-like isoleucine patch superfamily enzyme
MSKTAREKMLANEPYIAIDPSLKACTRKHRISCIHSVLHVLTRAKNVARLSAYHPLDGETRRTGVEMAVPITIGDDVWIGGGAIICPGVTIGNNTTIGAGSVVTKDIPANVIAVENPCKVIREL